MSADTLERAQAPAAGLPGEWRLYASVAAATMLGHAVIAVLPFETPAIASGFGLPDGKAGAITAFELMPLAIMQALMAVLGARVPPRLASLLGAALVIAASLLASLSTHLPAFVASRVLAGLGFGMAFAVANYAAAWAREPVRAYAIGLGVATIGYIGLQAVVGQWRQVQAHWLAGWPPQAGLYAVILAFAVIMVPFLFLLPRHARARQQQAATATTRMPWVPALMCLAIMALFAICAFTPYVYIETRGHAIGLTDEAFSLMFRVAYALCTFGTLAAALMGKRFGLGAPLAIGLAIMGASALGIMTTTSVAWMWGWVLVNFLLWNYLYGYLFGLGAAIDSLGRLSTAVGAVYLLGSAAAASIGGAILLVFDSYTVIGWVALAVALGAAALSLLVTRRQLSAGAA
jgi:predicted MFS family arabinose efflux permease